MFSLVDHQDHLCGPFFQDGMILDLSLFKGGGSKPKPKAKVRAEVPSVPKMQMPEIQTPELPPPPVPAPVQTLTTDQGQAEDDARTSALRRRGLASQSTIFAGPGGYKPRALGAGSGYGGSTLGGA